MTPDPENQSPDDRATRGMSAVEKSSHYASQRTGEFSERPHLAEFPGLGWDVPAEIVSALDAGELKDTSWRRELGPTFSVADTWDDTLACPRLVVMHVDPEHREEAGWPRFMVTKGDQLELGEVKTANDCFQTDDVNAALAKLREWSAEYVPSTPAAVRPLADVKEATHPAYSFPPSKSGRDHKENEYLADLTHRFDRSPEGKARRGAKADTLIAGAKKHNDSQLAGVRRTAVKTKASKGQGGATRYEAADKREAADRWKQIKWPYNTDHPYDSWECWALKVGRGRVILYPSSWKDDKWQYVASFGANSELSHSGSFEQPLTLDQAKAEIERRTVHGPEGLFQRRTEARNRDLPVGTAVWIDGGGVYDGAEAVIINPAEITTDGRGIPSNTDQGHYKPVDWRREYALRLTSGWASGRLITMFKNRVKAGAASALAKLKAGGVSRTGDRPADGIAVPPVSEAGVKYIVWYKEDGKWVEQGDGPLSLVTAERIVRELRKECGGRYKIVPVGHEPAPWIGPRVTEDVSAPEPVKVKHLTPEEAEQEFNETESTNQIIACYWPDRAGYYEQLPDGTFYCMVFNEQEIFQDEKSCRDWMYRRLEKDRVAEGKRADGKHITPYAGSWADQEARRPRKPVTPEQERQRRAGIVHPDIANATKIGEMRYVLVDEQGRYVVSATSPEELVTSEDRQDALQFPTKGAALRWADAEVDAGHGLTAKHEYFSDVPLTPGTEDHFISDAAEAAAVARAEAAGEASGKSGDAAFSHPHYATQAEKDAWWVGYERSEDQRHFQSELDRGGP